MNHYCTVIAEAGVNHNGKLALALELVDVAVSAKADIIKFQTFQPELLVTSSAPKAEYQKKSTGDSSQLDMLKKLALSPEDYKKIFEYAKLKKIKCISTPFDFVSLEGLLALGMDLIKIPSGEVSNAPFLLRMAQTGLPIILSTGMSTLDEIEKALSVIAFAYSKPTVIPKSFHECWSFWHENTKIRNLLKSKVTLLHCTTSYPADYSEINLNAMQTIANKFDLPVGYSDHSLGILVPVVAASLGAVIIEKHITLNKSMEGPDHAASLEPDELAQMVQNIRYVNVVKGNTIKSPTEAEMKNKTVARRGIYAARDIAIGEKFSLDNLVILRPENNVSPMDYWELINQESEKNYTKGSSIS